MAQRKKNGQFAKGYKGGPGRPKKTTEEKYLKALHTSVKIGDWKKIAEKAVDQALDGDAKAREWLSKYLIGEPDKIHHLNIDGDAFNWLEQLVISRDETNTVAAED